jgi:membrane dipeptidase
MDTRLDQVPRHPLEKGWHTPLSQPYLFVDGCVQIWPDADFAELPACGVTAYTITSFRPHDDAAAALNAMADWWRVARTYPNIRIAMVAADIEAAKAAGGSALILGSQGGDFLGNDLNRLEMFHRMGLRVMIPAYNARTALADGLLEPTNAGLSRMGRRWVAECNRLGIVMDMTHVGERSSLDVLEASAQPVLFTHSNPRALVESARNITDEQIRKCAGTGGVVGITNWGPLNFRPGDTVRPKLSAFLDAIAYVADLVGVDHVSIGTDMSHGTYPDGDLIRARNKASGSGVGYGAVVEESPRSRLRYVEGFDDYGKLLDVVAAMRARGFAEADVEKILGRNLLRVFAAVWG